MRPVLICLLLLVPGLGPLTTMAQTPAAVPEIPITVTDPDERLRLILNHLSGGTNSVYYRASQTNSTRVQSPLPARSSPTLEPLPAASLPGRIVPQAAAPQGNRVSSTPYTMSAVPANIAKHILREGDFIEMRVYQEDELNVRERLDAAGDVTLPLLGRVRLGGQTVEQARQKLEAMFAEDYLVDPQVVLTVIEYAKRRFAVLGQVQQPGFYNIAENETLNLLQAISMAGGFTRLANPTSITIKRISNGTELVLRADAKAMARDRNSKLMEVQAEDTIIVNQRIF